MPDDLFTTRKFEFSKIIDFLKLEIISVEYFLLLSCCLVLTKYGGILISSLVVIRVEGFALEELTRISPLLIML